jgi:hypothetical protein
VKDEEERVLAYLNSPVKNKRMKREVEKLKEYLEASNTDGNDNRVTIQFEVQGIPTKPKLPEWKDEITDETATPRREKE